MELGVSHVQNLSSLTPIVDNIFDKYTNIIKILVPIRSLPDHDILPSKWHHVLIDAPFLQQRTKNEPGSYYKYKG